MGVRCGLDTDTRGLRVTADAQDFRHGVLSTHVRILRKCDRSGPYLGVRWLGSEWSTCMVQELKPEKIIRNQACDH